jgi:hypothetical protein
MSMTSRHWPQTRASVASGIIPKRPHPNDGNSRVSSETLADAFQHCSGGRLLEAIAAVVAASEPKPVRGLPVAPLRRSRLGPGLHYLVTPIDRRGRLADRSPMHIVGWTAGQEIEISVIREIVMMVAQPGGADSVTREGHLRLPARIRHVCNIDAGARLLVATAPGLDLVMACATPTLDALLLDHYAGCPR